MGNKEQRRGGWRFMNPFRFAELLAEAAKMRASSDPTTVEEGAEAARKAKPKQLKRKKQFRKFGKQ